MLGPPRVQRGPAHALMQVRVVRPSFACSGLGTADQPQRCSAAVLLAPPSQQPLSPSSPAAGFLRQLALYGKGLACGTPAGTPLAGAPLAGPAAALDEAAVDLDALVLTQ